MDKQMDKQNQNSISGEVLARIKEEGVKMRPKFYFIAKAILWALAFVAIILFILYITSFVVFSLRASGTMFLPRFGFSGIKIFWLSLPWVPILLAGLAIIFLEILAKRFNWVWRRPVIYSFLGILLISLIGGFLLEKTPFHSQIFIKAQKEYMPGLGQFYRQFAAPQPQNARFGVVLSIQENNFIIQTPNNQTTTVAITQKTKISGDYTIKEGDKISVMGKIIKGFFEALEIRQVKGDFKFFPSPPPRQKFLMPTTTEI